ncbi:hypothetical protein, partial [Nostoc sp.]
AQTCNQDIYKPGLNATIIVLQPGLNATEPGLWFLATFGDDERLRALRQRAEGRRQKEERKE